MQRKGVKMDNYSSVLTLTKMVFDKIEFERKGFKNENELKFRLQVQIGKNRTSAYKVTLVLEGDKKDEYELQISLTGFFEIQNSDELSDSTVQALIEKNAVAILMPYLRSEVTLLTAQPETDSVVLPTFNINKLF